MKVNVYDPENVQKGRLILLNIAEDLREYAKVTVSPGKDQNIQQEEKTDDVTKKVKSVEHLQKMAED